jgi:DNA-binding transcriptional regulator YhcF (GntR family)
MERMGLVQPRNGNPDHVHYTTLTPRHPSPPQAISKCLFIKQQMIQGMRSKRFTDRLPSENQLAAAFGVSRMTARRALVELEAEGLVERIRGKGTYIKKPEPAMGYFVVQPSRRHAEFSHLAHHLYPRYVRYLRYASSLVTAEYRKYTSFLGMEHECSP